ncbi:MAG: hypothetical protein KKD28_09820 [Chloroflexi bacterium]|nr:hypothetical protein [Chloroflexota bacterium]
MKNTSPSLRYFGAFPDAFIEHIHQLIAIGYVDALPRIKVNDKKANEEPSITGFIITALTNRKMSLTPSPRWIMRYSFHDNFPVEHDGRIGSDRLMPDIIIEISDIGLPQFIIESKRLLKGQSTAGNYTGSEGMGCFIDGRYAGRYSEAGMLGYVQSDSIEVWAKKVREKIDKSSDELNLAIPQQTVNFHPQIQHEWVSIHKRMTSEGRSIKIYHILLDCIV